MSIQRGDYVRIKTGDGLYADTCYEVEKDIKKVENVSEGFAILSKFIDDGTTELQSINDLFLIHSSREDAMQDFIDQDNSY